MSSASDGLARWHALVEARDASGLPDLIADGAVFRSPAVHTPAEGKDATVGYLTAAVKVLGPELSYHREWVDDDSAVLEFTTRLDEIEVHGVDMIAWDEAGLIRDFCVMIRPKKALDKVIEQMGAELLRMLEAAEG